MWNLLQYDVLSLALIISICLKTDGPFPLTLTDATFSSSKIPPKTHKTINLEAIVRLKSIL